MSKFLWKSLLISPAVLGAVFAASSVFAAGSNTVGATQASQNQSEPQAAALEVSAPDQAPVQLAQVEPVQAPATSLTQIRKYSNEGKVKDSDSIGQVTSVSQLSDVQPTDWAFQALQSLVERYGVIAGYPDGTYRGNRAMTRYEFAAGLNAALDRVNELIAAGTADLVTKEDLATLQRLQEEFAAELATLRGRVDALEARTATLEAQQFSTTTKLVGEAIFEIASPLNNPRTGGTGTPSTNNSIVFQDRVRLALQTSFTGKDLLITRLDAGNAVAFNLPGGGSEATRPIQFAPNTTNSVSLGWLAYYLPLGDKAQLYIPAYAGLQYDYAPTFNPFLDAFDGGTGSISTFGQRNPIYDIGGGTGLGFNYNFNRAFGISLGYLASNGNTFAANLPQSGNGLFNGNYSALAQLNFTPSDAFGVGLTYVNAYRQAGAGLFDTGGGTGLLTGVTGTSFANNPGSAQVANAYGVSGYFKLSPQIVINGWGSYITSRGITTGDSDIWTYALGLAFPDLGRKGNLGGLIVGVQPYTAGVRNGVLLAPNNNPIHIEGFYKYQVSDNISITPGVIWIIAPGQNSANDNIVIGTLRTTFTF